MLNPRRSVPNPGVVVPTVAISVGESFLFFGYTGVVLWSYFVMLLLCVVVPLRLNKDVAVFQAFALVPVFRLVNLGMPVFVDLTLYWYPLVYGPLLPALYVVGRGNDAVSLSAGWKMGLLAVPLAVPLAAALGTVEFLLLEPAALVPVWSPTQLVLVSVVMVLFVGLVEELLFRGVLQQVLVARLGRWQGIVLTSVLFGLMHSGYGVPVAILFASLVGLLFGVLYDRTDSLVLVTVVHGVLNVFLFAVVPLTGLLSEVISLLP